MILLRRTLALPEKPIAARLLLLLCLCLNAVPAFAAPDASPLTEESAVRLALSRASLADIAKGGLSVAEGQANAAGTYDNPELAYLREELSGASATVEETLSVSQRFDLGNRRGLREEAGQARVSAVRRQEEAARLAVAAEARERFYEVIFRQGRVAALAEWVERVQQAREMVLRREQRGDAAAYELRRIDRERVVADTWLASEQAGLERAGARLEALLDGGGSGASTRASGSLLPESKPMGLEALQAATAWRPDLLALGFELEAADLEGRAAARWWIPDLRLEAGWKTADSGNQGRADGVLVGATFELPLWDQASAMARVAAGASQAARGQRALLESELRAELAGLHAEAERLHEVATRFGEQSGAASSDLVRMATLGHAGGEFTLLELLDAYRGATDDALRALELALAARTARIELDRLSGSGLP